MSRRESFTHRWAKVLLFSDCCLAPINALQPADSGLGTHTHTLHWLTVQVEMGPPVGRMRHNAFPFLSLGWVARCSAQRSRRDGAAWCPVTVIIWPSYGCCSDASKRRTKFHAGTHKELLITNKLLPLVFLILPPSLSLSHTHFFLSLRSRPLACCWFGCNENGISAPNSKQNNEFVRNHPCSVLCVCVCVCVCVCAIDQWGRQGVKNRTEIIC